MPFPPSQYCPVQIQTYVLILAAQQHGQGIAHQYPEAGCIFCLDEGIFQTYSIDQSTENKTIY